MIATAGFSGAWGLRQVERRWRDQLSPSVRRRFIALDYASGVCRHITAASVAQLISEVSLCFPVGRNLDRDADEFVDPLQAHDPWRSTQATSSPAAFCVPSASSSRAEWCAPQGSEKMEISQKIEELASKLVDDDLRLRRLEARDLAVHARRESSYWGNWLDARLTDVEQLVDHQSRPAASDTAAQVAEIEHKVDLLGEAMMVLKQGTDEVSG